MTPPERIEHVKHWLELKQAWERWNEGRPMPPLSEDGRAYFERLAGSAVRKYVDAHPGKFEHTAPPATDRECWAVLLDYLLRKRPKARLHLLDHIIESGIRKAAETLEGKLEGPVGLDHAINWIINRFNTQVVLSAMPDFLRQHKPPPRGTKVDAINAPLGESERTLEDTLSDSTDDRWWESEAEREEVEDHGRRSGVAWFETVRPAFRLSLVFRCFRQSRGVIISCDDRRVLVVAGVGKTVFADGARQTMHGLLAALKEVPALAELDRAAFDHAASAAAGTLTDSAESWFFSGQWMNDCCSGQLETRQKTDGPAPKDFCARFREHSEALAVLVRDRLRDAGRILAENEMAPVFQRLAGPVECP